MNTICAAGTGSFLDHQARRMGRVDDEVNQFTLEALFTTVTNVNFDPERLVGWIRKGSEMRNRLVAICREAAGTTSTPFEEELLPESARDKTLSSHEGEEFIVVQSGQIEIIYGKEVHRLEAGDSIYYNSVVPHHVACLGDSPASIYAVLYFPE